MRSLAGLAGAPIAHRGLWRTGGRPENSLAAFEAACAAGYGVELDVRLTADGEPIVFHDDGLDRMTVQSGLVEEHTADDLTALTLLGGERQHIPTLAQALETIAGRTLVLVELKTPPGQEGLLEARVAALLEAYAGPAAVLSFNARALDWLARRHPDIVRGLNIDAPAALDRLDELKPDFISIGLNLARSDHVQAWRRAGGLAVAWTARRPADKAALDGVVDNILFEGFAA